MTLEQVGKVAWAAVAHLKGNLDDAHIRVQQQPTRLVQA
jgi:hypothetical protein